MKALPKIAGALLILAGLVGIETLITDEILWLAAPIHAYTLIIFVLVNLGLGAMALFRGTKRIYLIALGWAALQLLALVGDVVLIAPFAAGRENFTIQEFGSYLFANPERVDIPVMTTLLLLVAIFAYLAKRESK